MIYPSHFKDYFTSKTRYQAMLFLVGGKIAVQKIEKEALYYTVWDELTEEAVLRIDKPGSFIQDHCTCGRSAPGSFCKHIAAGILLLNQFHYFDNSVSTMAEVLKDYPRLFQPKPRELKLVTPFDQEKKKPAVREYEPPPKPPVPKKSREELQAAKKAREEAKEREEKIKAEAENRIKEKLMSILPPGYDIREKKHEPRQDLVFVLNPKLSGVSITLEKAVLSDGLGPVFKGKVTAKDISARSPLSFEDEMLYNFFLMRGSSFDLGQKFFEYENTSAPSEGQEHLMLFPEMMRRILGESRLYWRKDAQSSPEPVQRPGVILQAVIKTEQKKDEYILRLAFSGDGEIDSLENVHRLMLNPMVVLYKGSIITIPNLTNQQYRYFRGQGSKVAIPDSLRLFAEDTLIPGLIQYIDVEGVNFRRIKEPEVLKKGVLLGENDMSLTLKLVFSYDDTLVQHDPARIREVVRNHEGYTVINRNKQFEREAYEHLSEYPLKETQPGVFLPRQDPVLFLHRKLDELKRDGFEIYGEKELKNLIVKEQSPRLVLTIRSGTDWFDLRGDVKFGEHTLRLKDLADSVKEGKQYIRLDDGSLGVLPESWVRKFMRVLPMSSQSDEGLLYSHAQALLVSEIAEEAESVEEDEIYTSRLERLKDFRGIQIKEIPDDINATVREYQKAGYSWLHFLKEFSFGGILADDMGLGKTLQVLMMLLHEKRNRPGVPSLIVAPTSLLFNWINESEKFTPELRFFRYHGGERKETDRLGKMDYDILITTYGIMLNDAEMLREIRFNFIILDESQKIKNPLSKTARAAYRLRGESRICVTGTPVENNLAELWSQFHFTNPGLLSSLNTFKQLYITPIQKHEDKDTLAALRKITFPFILRRTKELVAPELPEKTEIIHYCEMEEEQRKFYEYWRDTIKLDILSEIQEKGLNKSRIKILEGLLRLRQIANHPRLLKQKEVNKSGKFDEFRLLADSVTKENHKILVFSQFTKMLEILRHSAEKMGIQYAFLTGQTMNREEEVEKFQTNPEVKLFFISLKAGGFGLNLTAADYVIHYDPWWNPAAESQATDRAHRIGQNKKVFVYRLITRNTVEEKIIKLQEDKRRLAESVLSLEGSGFKNLTADDIKELFS
ncbi:MAG: hypothetical protein FMNOHCHN_02140 [Ignavibacteriaceae bacterium]|nr:hypothetical protein [Ignavibacteriaceae bacterium]